MEKKIGESYKVQLSLVKQELEQDEIYENTWEATENHLPTAFCYARYTMGMEEITKFGMRNSLTLPSLPNKNL